MRHDDNFLLSTASQIKTVKPLFVAGFPSYIF